ncbi:AMP-binding protein [Vineibacter terrae]|uniref:AMP-binding protein n=1 Tax=Vineibacter terrae TaxID=2586908 RepID=UPI002E343601|nr:AMP-binding protein [Vineibacter terrae]HEX2890657.1 AMP-binding protein [Vineibacter terrae]
MSHPVLQAPTATTMTLRALARFPDRQAFVWDGGSLTYAATLRLIGRLQAAMAASGLRKGQTMACLAANSAETWCAGVAAQALGLVVTWLHPLGSLGDHLDVVADSGAEALIVDPRTHGQRGGELAAQAADRLRTVLTMGRADFGHDVMAAAEKLGEASPVDLTDPDDFALINYTGGTTGKSKGAIRRHRSVAASTLAVAAGFEFPAVPRYLAAAPITHVSGSKVLPSLLCGGTVHLLKGFDPEKFLATIARERINCTLMVPTMIYVLLDHPALDKTDLSSLELILYGASPMSPTRLVEGLERIGPVFSQLYGQTECYPVSVLRKGDHDARRPELFASCGFALPSCAVSLRDEANNPVAQGEAGEICLRAPHAMESYWNRPEQTEEVFKGGWLHTGDIARADERGYLYIVDRKKDMIVSGGFNIFPREVEDVLASHPDVAQVAVIGVPHEKWGEAVTALVVAKAGTRPSPEALAQLVKSRKGGTHAPKQIEIVDSLPLTAVGKVDKKVLRARYWAGQARQVG